jgi:hypothetical protein
MSDIPQCPRPFTDRLAIEFIVTRAANDGSEWICVLVEGKSSELERMTQKPLGPSPYFVMLDDCEDSPQSTHTRRREHGLLESHPTHHGPSLGFA